MAHILGGIGKAYERTSVVGLSKSRVRESKNIRETGGLGCKEGTVNAKSDAAA